MAGITPESTGSMRVLKVVAEGITTSFRYPHFMLQIHPSYRMPPPSTIYGHICSALGDWVEPTGLAFGYHFTFQGEATDMEHIIALSAAGGKLPGTALPKVLEGNVNPYQRHLLFQPRLTLYVNRPEWLEAFRSPRYAVVLGRSQDLFTYTSVEVVELSETTELYLEHTLLPHEMVLQTMRGITVMMPYWMEYERGRTPRFRQYLMLEERLLLPSETETFPTVEMTPISYWTDPTAPMVQGLPRGVVFHTFT